MHIYRRYKNHIHHLYRGLAPEGVIWPAALLLLYFMRPHGGALSLCPLSLLGYKAWCPGCGLGHAIHYALHGQFAQSLHHHWLGIPALVLLAWRSLVLLKYNLNYIRYHYANTP